MPSFRMTSAIDVEDFDVTSNISLVYFISMNDDSVQLDTYTEVYDANDYPE